MCNTWRHAGEPLRDKQQFGACQKWNGGKYNNHRIRSFCSLELICSVQNNRVPSHSDSFRYTDATGCWPVSRSVRIICDRLSRTAPSASIRQRQCKDDGLYKTRRRLADGAQNCVSSSREPGYSGEQKRKVRVGFLIQKRFLNQKPTVFWVVWWLLRFICSTINAMNRKQSWGRCEVTHEIVRNLLRDFSQYAKIDVDAKCSTFRTVSTLFAQDWLTLRVEYDKHAQTDGKSWQSSRSEHLTHDA